VAMFQLYNNPRVIAVTLLSGVWLGCQNSVCSFVRRFSKGSMWWVSEAKLVIDRLDLETNVLAMFS